MPPPAAVEAGGAPPTMTSVPWDVVELLGQPVAPGDRRRLSLRAGESFAGDAVDIPVLVVRGTTPGPTLCLVAGVHGDELNGIEIVRKVFEELAPRDVSGMLVGVPVANVHGLRRSSRYLPDQRDLNRFFPGHPGGSSASRIANALFESVVEPLRRAGGLPHRLLPAHEPAPGARRPRESARSSSSRRASGSARSCTARGAPGRCAAPRPTPASRP